MKLHNRKRFIPGASRSVNRFLQKILVLSTAESARRVGSVVHARTACHVLGQQARSISFPTSIQWTQQQGVAKYRLQIASDEYFRSIFFDGRVNGERYTVSGLPPGYYFWRTAPANFQAGQFSKPVRFFVSGGAVVPAKLQDKSGRRSRVRTISTAIRRYSRCGRLARYSS